MFIGEINRRIHNRFANDTNPEQGAGPAGGLLTYALIDDAFHGDDASDSRNSRFLVEELYRSKHIKITRAIPAPLHIWLVPFDRVFDKLDIYRLSLAKTEKIKYII